MDPNDFFFSAERDFTVFYFQRQFSRRKKPKGKIIIPAEFKDYTGIKEGESVPEGIGNETILFAGGKRNDRFEKIPLDTCMIEKVIFYTSLIYLITEQTTSQKGSEGL